MISVVFIDPSKNHIFCGKSILRKSYELTTKYGRDNQKFRKDYNALRSRCMRIAPEAAKSTNIKHIDEILKLLGFVDGDGQPLNESSDYLIVPM